MWLLRNSVLHKLDRSVEFINLQRVLHLFSRMACSRFEYVKNYEQDDAILPNVWIVIRLDGKGFHKFSKAHEFAKPNDANGIYTKVFLLLNNSYKINIFCNQRLI